MKVGFLIAVGLFLAGCSTERPLWKGDVYQDGPVQVYVGLTSDVMQQCRGRAGCAGRGPEGESIIVCPTGNLQCIAHEVRHLLQPNWKHE